MVRGYLFDVEAILVRALLISPARVQRNLDALERAGICDPAPNLWQVTLGCIRMWHRVLFRSETIGTSEHPRRRSLRARLLSPRPIRFPFLVWERAIAPLDLSGLASRPERIARHMMGAFHDADRFVYDLELLAAHPKVLKELRDEVQSLVKTDSRRARWLRDLVVYEGYHEALLERVEEAIDRGVEFDDVDHDDPDLTLSAFLRWCRQQPVSYQKTVHHLRAGDYHPGRGLVMRRA